jgi:hypothetical protein
MTRHEIIERAAAGLRNMDEAPDAFMYAPINYDETWDDLENWNEPEILGIPVYHFDCPIFYHYNGGLTIECPFMPIWKSERSDKQFMSKYFFQGWEDLDYKD